MADRAATVEVVLQLLHAMPPSSCILLPFKTHWLALRPAAAARPPRPAGPTTGPGVHAVGPARWQVLLVLGEDLLARSLPRYQAAGVIFRPLTSTEAPAGAPRRRTAGTAVAPRSLYVALRAAQTARGRGDAGKGDLVGYGAAYSNRLRQKQEEVTARAPPARRPQGGGFGWDLGRCGGGPPPLAALCAASKPRRGRQGGRVDPARGAAGARGGGGRRGRARAAEGGVFFVFFLLHTRPPSLFLCVQPQSPLAGPRVWCGGHAMQRARAGGHNNGVQ
jgi:hypothetical protein